MNVVYALSAYPAGVLSDRIDRKVLLAAGLVFLAGADLALALMPTFGGVALGVILWGLHMGLTQGLFATLVADSSPPELRGSAYGFFNQLTGGAMLAASVVAGWVWMFAVRKAHSLRALLLRFWRSSDCSPCAAQSAPTHNETKKVAAWRLGLPGSR
jgi:MFS family permease